MQDMRQTSMISLTPSMPPMLFVLATLTIHIAHVTLTWLSGTSVDGSTACAASSMITTSKGAVILANTPDPANDSVLHTTDASSRIDIRTWSFWGRWGG